MFSPLSSCPLRLSLSPQTTIQTYQNALCTPETPPLICFHGWLDNAASFFPLAELFPDLAWCATDLIGHGQSSWRPSGNFYYFWDYLCDTVDLIETHFPHGAHLAGHSLGSGVALLLAGLLPDKVLSVTLFDGFGPLVSPPSAISEQLRLSLQQHAQPRAMRHYGGIYGMALARKKRHDIALKSCRILAEFGHRREKESFFWSFDPRLFYLSPFQMVEEQVIGIMEHIVCPVLLMQAQSGYHMASEIFEQRKAALGPLLTHKVVPGAHHAHMDHPENFEPDLRHFWKSIGLL